jgi:tetratricopeptide (TPR) repeat protein
MYRKSLLTSLFIVSVIFAGVISASAQTFLVRGTVKVRDAQGNLAPMPGATVEGFRLDTAGKTPPATTNKRGEYTIVGLQAGGLYALTASAPAAAPKLINNVRSNVASDPFDFNLEAGDGHRYSQDEVVSMTKGGANPSAPGASGVGGATETKLTDEQKKAQAEYQKAKTDNDAKNAKINVANGVIQRTFKDGNAALLSGDDAVKNKNFDGAVASYTTAITDYDEGINADPAFLGSAPMLMNNKSIALAKRGGQRYNKSVNDKDDTLKGQAKEDIVNAYETAKKSYDMVTSSEAQADTQSAPSLPKSKYDSLANMAEALRLMTVSKLDMTHSADIAKVYTELMTIETVPDKKAAQQVTMADLLMTSGDCDGANAEYQKILTASPNNVDALAGNGLCTIALAGDDKAKIQEGLNILQSFVDQAPDTHKYKASARETIEYFKTEQKITPQKGAARPAAKKKP